MSHNETDLDSILAEFSDSGTDYTAEAPYEEPLRAEPVSSVTQTEKKPAAASQPHPASPAKKYESVAQRDSHSPSPARVARRSSAHYIPPEPVQDDEAESERRQKKSLTKKQKRRRRNIFTLILVCLLILAGAAGIYITVTHESRTDTVKQEISLTERVEKTITENEASASSEGAPASEA